MQPQDASQPTTPAPMPGSSTPVPIPGSSHLPPKKRQRNRAALSCAECRRLKLKCSRVWPCSNCEKRNCADICPNLATKPPGRAVRVQAEMAALVDRVALLESIIRDAGAEQRIPPRLHLEFAGQEGGSKGNAAPTVEVKEEEDVDEEDNMQEEEEGGSSAGQAVPDELIQGVGSLSIREDDGRVRYLGASAGAAYFAQEDNEWSNDDTEGIRTPPAAHLSVFPFIQLGNSYPKHIEIERLRTFLPAQVEAERLAKNYWSYMSFQFEPVEESVFWEDYLPAAQSIGVNGNGPKLAVVFMILALGSVMDPRAPSTPNSNAYHYFTLAMTTLSAARFLSHSTIAGVQTLILAASFLLNTHDLQEGGETLWPLLGMAAKMLVGMGMHRDGSQWGLSGSELDRRRLVFHELNTLERMQAFISGRPYALNPAHCDTLYPSTAEPYHVEKWMLGSFIAKVIDQGFSIKEKTPYATIGELDQELRDMWKDSPKELRSGALPERAFFERVTEATPTLPTENHNPGGSLKLRMRQHTLDMIFTQIMFYMHLPALRHALSLYPDEPLSSPYAASVLAISMEASVYMLALAKSFVDIHPVLSPRWWHILFHSFSAAVAQSSILIKSPTSLLARHSWEQLNLAIDIFEVASTGGAPVSNYVPRLLSLRENAYLSLQNALSVPRGLERAQVSEHLAAGTDASLLVLGPVTRLDRKLKKRPGFDSSSNNASPTSLLEQALASGTATPASVGSTLPSLPSNELYTPFDSPILASSQTGFHFTPDLSPQPGMSQLPTLPSMATAPSFDFLASTAQAGLSGASTPAPGPLNYDMGMGFTTFATGANFPDLVPTSWGGVTGAEGQLPSATGPLPDNWIWLDALNGNGNGSQGGTRGP